MIDEIIYTLEGYIKLTVDFLVAHIMTIEGIVGLIFGLFLLGLVSRLRS